MALLGCLIGRQQPPRSCIAHPVNLSALQGRSMVLEAQLLLSHCLRKDACQVT